MVPACTLIQLGAYKLLRNEFSYKPPLTSSQFLTSGFAERKIMMLCDIIHLCKKKHEEIIKSMAAPKQVPPAKKPTAIVKQQADVEEVKPHAKVATSKKQKVEFIHEQASVQEVAIEAPVPLEKTRPSNTSRKEVQELTHAVLALKDELLNEKMLHTQTRQQLESLQAQVDVMQQTIIVPLETKLKQVEEQMQKQKQRYDRFLGLSQNNHTVMTNNYVFTPATEKPVVLSSAEPLAAASINHEEHTNSNTTNHGKSHSVVPPPTTQSDTQQFIEQVQARLKFAQKYVQPAFTSME